MGLSLGSSSGLSSGLGSRSGSGSSSGLGLSSGSSLGSVWVDFVRVENGYNFGWILMGEFRRVKKGWVDFVYQFNKTKLHLLII